MHMGEWDFLWSITVWGPDLVAAGWGDRLDSLVLEPEVGRYILARAPRAMPALLALLDRLDAGSLAAGRRLSIPFVRECLGWQA